jgi:hypothetical protein
MLGEGRCQCFSGKSTETPFQGCASWRSYDVLRIVDAQEWRVSAFLRKALKRPSFYAHEMMEACVAALRLCA